MDLLRRRGGKRSPAASLRLARSHSNSNSAPRPFGDCWLLGSDDLAHASARNNRLAVSLASWPRRVDRNRLLGLVVAQLVRTSYRSRKPVADLAIRMARPSGPYRS